MHRTIRLAVAAAVLGPVALATLGQALDDTLGINGGIRLLLHVTPADLPPRGIPTTDPCNLVPAVTMTEDIVVEYDGPADTLMAWVYLHHPLSLAVKGVGFGIRYEGIDVITSGCCAEHVYQDEKHMGKWAESGSEIAFAWGPIGYPAGDLVPIAWFVLAREKKDGFFELHEGASNFAGAVVDTNRPSRYNLIHDFGRIGFGDVAGVLPVVNPATVPGAWGAVSISAQ